MSRELLKRALESMRRTRSIPTGESVDTMRAIEAELAKPDPEPVGYLVDGWLDLDTKADDYYVRSLSAIEAEIECPENIRPLYTTPPDQSARIAELIAQRSMQEESIKTTTQRCVELEKQVSDRDEALLHQTVQLHEMQTKPYPEPIAYITGFYGGYPTINVIDGAVLPSGTPLYAAAPSERKPIGYIPQHSAATIKREGLWDACTLYRTKVNPTDVEVFL